MKKLIFMIFCNIFSQLIGESIYSYKSNYVEYSYYSNYTCVGCIKGNIENSELKDNILSELPFDGKIIILDDKKKLYYIDVHNSYKKLESKKIKSEVSGKIVTNQKLGNKGETIDIGKIQVNDFKYDSGFSKEMKYYEIPLSSIEYDSLIKKILVLKRESEKMRVNDNIYTTANLTNEYVTRLGYISEFNVLGKNFFYCDIDIKKLVESENKIYILSNEINEELEKIVSKSI